MKNCLLIITTLLELALVADGCKKFLSSKFVEEHRRDWTYMAANDKCRFEHFQHGALEKRFLGQFSKSPVDIQEYHDVFGSIMIFKYHCAAECFNLHGRNHSSYRQIGMLPLGGEDSEDPTKVSIACLCNGITRSDFVNMKRLHEAYTKRCLRTPNDRVVDWQTVVKKIDFGDDTIYTVEEDVGDGTMQIPGKGQE